MNVLALKIFMVIVASMRQVGKSKGPVVLEMKYDSPFYPCSENLHYIEQASRSRHFLGRRSKCDSTSYLHIVVLVCSPSVEYSPL